MIGRSAWEDGGRFFLRDNLIHLKARVTVKDRGIGAPHTDSVKGWIGRVDTKRKVLATWGLVTFIVALISRKWGVVGSAE